MPGRQAAAIVTGAGGGLGRVVAHRLAMDGQPVACIDMDQGALRTTCSNITAAGGTAVAFPVDLADRDEVLELGAHLLDQFDAIRSLVNIAGVLARFPVTQTSLKDWDQALAVNLTGPFVLMRSLADALRTANNGRIINCASISASVGYPFGAYAASKAALSNLTRSALFDFWGTNVTVNAVSPGAMDTPMLNVDARREMVKRTPSGAIASPEDVANVIAFLNSVQARAVNGVDLVVDGGATAVFSYSL